ncbi:hypothetical protein OM076_10085 [Solirubrobacter ginsenosidimutans]|uniref:Uncharacterized protein n=1 Tax=Solirubrobacter ginsenosidimutans TaxID=490573 RepID=A0A9X3MVD6_9ACTN|nr:hypothetical protein [Solirubrobacter ginsenosidimutans]MDA0160613.1 hypothetical protein [Solirubrobacter ginsenosidimutans]
MVERGRPVGAAAVLALQRSAGNRAVCEALRPRTAGVARAPKPEPKPQRPRLRSSRGSLQRLIVNVGHDMLDTELRKDNGWIIAKDIEIALRDGGVTQQVRELALVSAYKGLKRDENIYLVGHGAPGFVGVKDAEEVAAALGLALPEDYAGKIKSLSCSTGTAPMPTEKEQRYWSGVAELAALLERVSVPVEGAYGIALNHPAFQGAKRTVKPGADNWDKVLAEIVKTQKYVDAAWKNYVAPLAKQPMLEPFMTIPLMAEMLSRPFYVDLERRIEPYLVDKTEDTTIAVSSGTGFSSIILDLHEASFKA